MSIPQSIPSPPFPSFSGLPLIPENIRLAHNLIKPYIHRTPLLTCQTLDNIASTPRRAGGANPKINLYFKCESYQKIGAFKARGAFHAVIRWIEKYGMAEGRRRGVVTHSSGNHAQALALAASTFQIPAYIVMPTISTPSKIAATQALTPHVTFSGTTSQEREEKVEEVIALTGAVLVPPYEHGDIVLGQGTVGLEIEEQFAARREGQVCTVHGIAPGEEQNPGDDVNGAVNGIARRSFKRPTKQLDAIIAPCGGGGLLSGLATYFSDNQDEDLIGPAPNSAPPQRPSHPPPSAPSISLGQHDELTANPDAPLAPHTSKTQPQPRPRSTPFIFGAEPSFQSADDALRSLQLGHRITTVRSLTIADGLRTPLGHITWDVIRKKENVEGIHSVSEDEIKHAMRLLIERAKLVVEPSGNVGLAVVLFDEGFRGWVEGRQREEAGQAREAKGKGGAAEGVRVGEEEIRPWDIGIVLSGGNTTVEAIAGLFGATSQQDATEERKHSDKTREVVERQEAKVTMDGERVAEDIAG